MFKKFIIFTVLAFNFGCSNVIDNEINEFDTTEGANEPEVSTNEDALTGNFSVGTPLTTMAYVNHRSGPSVNYSVLQVIPPSTRVLSAASAPRSGWYGVTWNGKTGWVHGDYLKNATATNSNPSTGTIAGVSITSLGQDQMRRIVIFADANNSGASRGRCFQYVWGYLWKSKYGYIDEYNDASDMPSAEARNFAEYMNRNGNAARWGLQRLNITNPYDAPRGSIVVVAAGSPGTAHPTAGDIAISAGGGRFINDGPNMGYGGSRQAFINGGGRVLGVYVPR